jgi:hypothetical protein
MYNSRVYWVKTAGGDWTQQVRAKRLSFPPLALDVFSPYHVQTRGASSTAASDISNGYQLGEGGGR